MRRSITKVLSKREGLSEPKMKACTQKEKPRLPTHVKSRQLPDSHPALFNTHRLHFAFPKGRNDVVRQSQNPF